MSMEGVKMLHPYGSLATVRRVDDLRADCLYTGISSGPNAR